jgi:Domain of unknown function (DUF1995)
MTDLQEQHVGDKVWLAITQWTRFSCVLSLCCGDSQNKHVCASCVHTTACYCSTARCSLTLRLTISTVNALPQTTHHALAPPRAAQLVETLGLGGDCLCILLNARLDGTSGSGDGSGDTLLRARLRGSFDVVFHLRGVAAGDGSGDGSGGDGDGGGECLLYRAYPRDWTLARKPKVGPPKVLAIFEARPSAEEVATAATTAAAETSKGLFGGLF